MTASETFKKNFKPLKKTSGVFLFPKSRILKINKGASWWGCWK
ncbi:hypothetical protein predicted by Glimmer/Critica [Bdellovibrio bacteriovorus HD100]|uniref:Uncharacterized protein n=1 Tax=Bdellovibrio bacteriovorus (strain ATCC 15356 / DSM 50701 / NCIMB 9529 / HD100) TaxID=264462 RepID=Q6MLX1_BDEBA|nr:hypothetical protein predicted by Glimmer/Critica [Bdellovibrio bacteriovorus HD100]